MIFSILEVITGANLGKVSLLLIQLLSGGLRFQKSGDEDRDVSLTADRHQAECNRHSVAFHITRTQEEGSGQD